MNWSLTVDEIVTLLEASPAEGIYAGSLSGIADMRTACEGDLTFLGNPRFKNHLAETKASVILVPEGTEGGPNEGQVWLRVKDPSLALGVICQHIEDEIRPRPEVGSIHATAVISESAKIDPSASIGPYCIVGENAVIGPKVHLQSSVQVEANVTIGEGTSVYHGSCVGWGTRIGRNCTLFAGAVIGGDGFGFHSDQTGHSRLAQVGVVVIEDDVEVGCNSTIDRARFSETRIGEGTKIDNLVQIGHNVIIGKHCILCSLVGVSGSVEIGNFVILAGQVGVAGHIKIGDGVTATGQTGISKDVSPGMVLSGTPAMDHREEMKRMVRMKHIPEMRKRIKKLEETLCK